MERLSKKDNKVQELGKLSSVTHETQRIFEAVGRPDDKRTWSFERGAEARMKARGGKELESEIKVSMAR